MPRVLSSTLPAPVPPLPPNAVQFRAKLTLKNLESYVVYPPFAASMTPTQIAGLSFGGSKEVRATRYGMFQQWSYMIPKYKWNGQEAPTDGRQAKTVMEIPKTFWEYNTSSFSNDILSSSAVRVPPVGFTPARQLKYLHGTNTSGELEMPSGDPALTSPLFAGVGAFIKFDTPYPDENGRAPWFSVIPICYLRVTMNRCIDESNGSWVYKKYNPNNQTWENVSQPEHYYLTLWLVADEQRVRLFLLPSNAHPFDYVNFNSSGTSSSNLMQQQNRGVGIVEVRWPSGTQKTQRTKAHHVRGGVLNSDKVELVVEHYVLHRRVPKKPWTVSGAEDNLVLPVSKIAVIINNEWYEFDAAYAVVESYSLSSYIGFGQIFGMVTAIFPALKDGWDLARSSAYNMPASVPQPKYYVNNSRPAIAIAYPVCRQAIGVISIPFSTGYRPHNDQVTKAEMDAVGFMRPLFLSSSFQQDAAGRPMLVKLFYQQGVVYDQILGDTFWANIEGFSPACVIGSISLRLPGKTSTARNFPEIDITPYISFISVRSQFVPSELREVQSVMIQLDAIDDHLANGIVNYLMNQSGVHVLDLELYSNAGGIAFSDFNLNNKHHPAAYLRVQLPLGMEKQYRVQITNRALILYAHDWMHFLQNVPIRIAPFFDGWCWREAVRFLWQLGGIKEDIWLFDGDNSRCQQGPYPKQLDSNGNPVGECPHYKLPIGPLAQPYMKFPPEIPVSQAIYQILTLLKRISYYTWVQEGGQWRLKIATKPFREVVDVWQSPTSAPIAVITTGTYSAPDLCFPKLSDIDNTTSLNIPVVESSFLVIGQSLWGIRTVAVAAGYSPIGYPVIESRRMPVWGVSDPNLAEQYMLGQQSAVFVAVPRPSIETDPIFVDPNAAKTYLDYLSATNYPSNRISVLLPPLWFPLGSIVEVRRGATLYRKCWVAEIEHSIRRGGQSTTSLGLRLVQNVV